MAKGITDCSRHFRMLECFDNIGCNIIFRELKLCSNLWFNHLCKNLLKLSISSTFIWLSGTGQLQWTCKMYHAVCYCGKHCWCIHSWRVSIKKQQWIYRGSSLAFLWFTSAMNFSIQSWKQSPSIHPLGEKLLLVSKIIHGIEAIFSPGKRR